MGGFCDGPVRGGDISVRSGSDPGAPQWLANDLAVNLDFIVYIFKLPNDDGFEWR